MNSNPTGREELDGQRRTAAEWLWTLLPIGASVFCLSSLVYYHLYHDQVQPQSTLQVAIASLYASIGFAPACLFFFLLLTWSSIWFVVGSIERPLGRLLRLAAMTVMLGVFMNLGAGGVTPAFHKGELGAWFATRLVGAFGVYPSLVLVWLVTFASLLLATDYFFSSYFERLRATSGEEPVEESGVEVAVTEELKQLANAPLPMAAPVPARDDVEPVAADTVDEALAVETDEPEVEPVVELPLRRRSYFDRRQAAIAAEVVAEPWVPTGPEAQEIENPETVAEGMPSPPEPAAPVAEAVMAMGEPPIAAEPVAEEPVAQWAVPEMAAPVQPEVVAGPAQLVFAEAGNDPEQFAAAPAESLPETAATPPQSESEPIVAIPRPEVEPAAVDEPVEPVRQQSLFAVSLDPELVQEAIDVVTEWRRASATFLQRKLRIDYPMACRVLAELAARGVVELEADASHGRVRG